MLKISEWTDVYINPVIGERSWQQENSRDPSKMIASSKSETEMEDVPIQSRGRLTGAFMILDELFLILESSNMPSNCH